MRRRSLRRAHRRRRRARESRSGWPARTHAGHSRSGSRQPERIAVNHESEGSGRAAESRWRCAGYGDGSGKPDKDVSVNFVAFAYPEYRAGTNRNETGHAKPWRIVNASSITYLNLQLLFAGNGHRAFGIVAMDGIPINPNGPASCDLVVSQNHLGRSARRTN